jgi:hypothetical protein
VFFHQRVDHLNVGDEATTLNGEKQLDLVAIHMEKAESKFHRCKATFSLMMDRMWKNHRSCVQGKTTSQVSINMIEQYVTETADKWRSVFSFRENFHFRHSYDNQTDSSSSTWHAPRFICHIQHTLNGAQQRLLNRGPANVPPCQLFISETTSQMNVRLKQQYAPLKHQMTHLFPKYHINIAQSMDIDERIHAEFNRLFSLSIPLKVEQHAVYEMKLVRTVGALLESNDWILRRTADRRATFYLDDRARFERLCDDYMASTNAFRVIMTIDDVNCPSSTKDDWHEMIESMNFISENLSKQKVIDRDLWQRLYIDESKIRRPHLYFLPDVSQVNYST